MQKIDIAGLKIDIITRPDLLNQILVRAKNNQKTFLTTTYSEFLHAGLKNPKILEMLNQANIAVADGIAIIWAN
jgi:UDP-N-acetyl-D-mannosaminuronic acid transferase (WecB/TagA/CpsF family)